MKRKVQVQRKQIALSWRSADVLPSSVNDTERTVDVVYATDTPILRRGWSGKFLEVLSFKDGAVRTARLDAGANVLDNHASWGSVKNNVLGVVVRNAIEGQSRGVATLKISKSEEKLWQDIKDGIVRNVSVGYDVYEYHTNDGEENEIPTYTATDWEPGEISFTGIPADYNSTVRNAQNQNDLFHEVKIKTRMKKVLRSPDAAITEGGGGTTTTETAPKGGEGGATATRTKEDGEGDPEPKPKADAAEKLKKRNSDIMQGCRTAGLDLEFAETLINSEMSVSQARAKIIDKIAEMQSPGATRSGNPQFKVGLDEREKRADFMSDAILLRAGYGQYDSAWKPKDEAATREFRGMTLLDMAKDQLEFEGHKIRGMSKREIAELSLGLTNMRPVLARSSSGALGTSDFSYLMANTINRTLRQMYNLAPRTFEKYTRRTTINDFRPVYRVQISNLADVLAQIPENGEYTATKMTDTAETYILKKYGKKIVLSWESIVNDDLNAFTRIPQAIANAAAQTQSNIMYTSLLIGNPNMSDGVALFHATHKNLRSAGAAISLTTLADARTAFRNQTDMNGNFLNLVPKYLIVGPSNEATALQFMSVNYVATKSGDINVWQGSMEVIVEPRITDNSYYFAVDPSQLDTLEYAFLEGEGELFTEQRIGFDVDGLEVKARMVFGAAPIDFRGLYKVPTF